MGKLSGNRFQPTFKDEAGRFFFYSLDSPHFPNYLIRTLINILLLDQIFVKHPDEHLQLFANSGKGNKNALQIVLKTNLCGTAGTKGLICPFKNTSSSRQMLALLKRSTFRKYFQLQDIIHSSEIIPHSNSI